MNIIQSSLTRCIATKVYHVVYYARRQDEILSQLLPLVPTLPASSRHPTPIFRHLLSTCQIELREEALRDSMGSMNSTLVMVRLSISCDLTQVTDSLPSLAKYAEGDLQNAGQRRSMMFIRLSRKTNFRRKITKNS